MKESKKKQRLPSAKEDKSKRDWGKGMACAGRTKECTIVPPNHFGPIPGVDVGTCWKFRLNVSLLFICFAKIHIFLASPLRSYGCDTKIQE